MTTESTSFTSPSSHLNEGSDDRPGRGPDSPVPELKASSAEHKKELQSRARDFIRLLHRMPIASSKKQLAIRLLVKVVRLATSVDVRPDVSSAPQECQNGGEDGHTPSTDRSAAMGTHTASGQNARPAHATENGSKPDQSDDADAAPSQAAYRNVVGI